MAPALCVSILGFSWKLIAGIEPAQSSGGAAVLVGVATAALLVVALELFLSKGFDILHICQVLFPALTVVFLLPSLFGQQYTTPVSYTHLDVYKRQAQGNVGSRSRPKHQKSSTPMGK